MANIPLKAIVFFLSIFSLYLQAQPTPQHFRATHYGVEQGLSQGSNYFMLRDSRNFYWFSSYEGLDRFDGRHFQRFYNNANDSTAMRGAEVLGMVEDAGGNIWLGTEHCLNRYDRMSGKFSSYFLKDEKGENTYSQTHPFFADSTEVWFANELDGIVRYDFKSGEKTVMDTTLRYKMDYYFNFRAQCLGKGDFWINQQKGLVHYNQEKGTKDWYFSEHPDNITGLPSEIFAYYVVGEYAWVGLQQGLFKLDICAGEAKEVDAPFDLSKNIIYCIREDKAGRVWLGTADDGVLIFDTENEDFYRLADMLGQPQRYAATQAAAMQYDSTDNLLWVNTEPNGLDKITLEASAIRSYHFDPTDHAGLNAPVVRCFTEDKKGRIWIGVWDGGINVFDPKTGQFDHHIHTPNDPNTLPNKSVLGICHDQNSVIWAATENGVASFDTKAGGKRKWRRYYNHAAPSDMVNSNLCQSICSLPNGKMAVGTNNGLFLLDPTSGLFTPMSPGLPDMKMVRNLLYDAERKQLYATAHSDGFWVFKLENGKWSKTHELLKGLYTNCFHLVPGTDTLWGGTTQGLLRYHLNDLPPKLYTVEDGLPSNTIYGILRDEQGRLWLSTNRGISCFDPRLNSFENYSPNDGCQGFEYNINAFYRASWGELYFGGTNGFDRFYPDKIQRNHPHFPVYLTEFEVNNRDFPLDTVIGEATEIRLHHFENTFSIRFASLNWHFEDEPAYRFRLPPFQTDWVVITAGDDVARFVNVPPGTYRFEVEAASRPGLWKVPTTTVNIVIVPAFWQTLWFKVLMVLAAIGLVAGLVSFYQKTRYHLQIAEAEKSIEKERLRTRIAQDIHDDVGASLTKISLAAQVASRLPNLNEDELKVRMEKLGIDARYAADHLREIVFAINPDYDNFEEMQAYFREVSREFWAEGTVTLHFDFEKSKTNSTVPPDVKRQLLLIFKEAQNNIAKHAKASQAWLSFKLVDEKNYLLLVRDDGIGFDTAAGNGFTHGLSGIKKRAESIHAELSIESSPQNGTTLKVEGQI
jgi:signal transduction histidine kinase/ligand-binding sensor domain-containing protein